MPAYSRPDQRLRAKQGPIGGSNVTVRGAKVPADGPRCVTGRNHEALGALGCEAVSSSDWTHSKSFLAYWRWGLTDSPARPSPGCTHALAHPDHAQHSNPSGRDHGDSGVAVGKRHSCSDFDETQPGSEAENHGRRRDRKRPRGASAFRS